MKNKIRLTIAIAASTYAFYLLGRPAATLASNKLIVNQMQSSNEAALSVQYIGSGEAPWFWLVAGVAAMALIYIWTRETDR